jgi:hypothetical protein
VTIIDIPPGALNGAAVVVQNGWFDTVDLSGPHTPRSLRRIDDA